MLVQYTLTFILRRVLDMCITLPKFEIVTASGKKKGNCVVCGKLVVRSHTCERLATPYNRDRYGEIKSYADVQEDADAELRDWQSRPVLHVSCEAIAFENCVTCENRVGRTWCAMSRCTQYAPGVGGACTAHIQSQTRNPSFWPLQRPRGLAHWLEGYEGVEVI